MWLDVTVCARWWLWRYGAIRIQLGVARHAELVVVSMVLAVVGCPILGRHNGHTGNQEQ